MTYSDAKLPACIAKHLSSGPRALPDDLKTETLVAYDTARFDFRGLAEEILGVSNLEELHKTPEAQQVLVASSRHVKKAGKSSRNTFNKRWKRATGTGGSHRDTLRALLSRFCAEANLRRCDDSL